jgi:hypothetical protein
MCRCPFHSHLDPRWKLRVLSIDCSTSRSCTSVHPVNDIFWVPRFWLAFWCPDHKKLPKYCFFGKKQLRYSQHSPELERKPRLWRSRRVSSIYVSTFDGTLIVETLNENLNHAMIGFTIYYASYYQNISGWLYMFFIRRNGLLLFSI